MLRLLLVTTALYASVTANAALVVFNFDDLGNQDEVPANYGGASWSGFTSSVFVDVNSQLYTAAYTSAPIGILDYAPGFTALTFSAAMYDVPGTFEVWDDLGGTGTLLGALTLNNPPVFPLSPTGVAFSGLGKSVVVSGGQYLIVWDDVTLTVAENSVPEPGSWALVLTGFGLAGIAMRRRRLAVAA